LHNQTRWDLEHQGALLTLLASDLVQHARQTDSDAGLAEVSYALSDRLRRAKAATWSGIRVVDEQAIVVATSGQTLGEDISSDPEVRAALEGDRAAMLRPREPTLHPLSSPSRRSAVRLFVAVPVEVDGQVLGAIVLSRTPREELQALYQMAPARLFVGTGLALLATLGGGFWLGFLLTRSLSGVAAETTRIAEGSFDRVDSLRDATQSHVHDVAQLALSVGQMSERLQRRLAYISEFASNVSHEFKTPLATLRGTIELMSEDEAMPAEQRARFLRNAEHELIRMQQLVDGLLVLARAEETGDRQAVNLNALLGQVVQRFEGVSLDGQSGPVLGNLEQLGSVAENLIHNAVRHGAMPIGVRSFVERGCTGFEVVDAGQGITEANQQRVFDRFFTTRRDDGGTGLGLALVRAVVVAHGGDVTVASTPGETVFRVSFPLHQLA
jgi:signal transduction histidine kinase